MVHVVCLQSPNTFLNWLPFLVRTCLNILFVGNMNTGVLIGTL